VVHGGPERSWSTKGGCGPHGPTGPLRSILIHTFLKFYGKCGPGWIKVDQEDQGDNNPPWWTRSGFYILLMHSVSPESALLDLDHPYLVAGDCNIHNAATDPSLLLSSKEEKESAPYFDRASDLGFTLLNTPGICTRFPFSRTHRPGTIDLAFANPHMFSAFRSLDTSSLPSTGSDHAPIVIALRPPTPHNNKPRPRWQEADWLGLADRLKNWLTPPPPPPLP